MLLWIGGFPGGLDGKESAAGVAGLAHTVSASRLADLELLDLGGLELGQLVPTPCGLSLQQTSSGFSTWW